MANRVILGEFNGDYVLRVSRPGYNVLDPNLPRKNLAFDSRWPETLQVVNAGRVFFPNSEWQISVPHGGPVYSTGPVVFMWIVWGNSYIKLDTSFGAGAGHANFRGWTTTTTIEVRRDSGGSNNPDVWLNFITMRQSNG